MPDSQIKATYVDHMGSDLSVVNAARVSFGKKSQYIEDNLGVWHLDPKDERLINYLAKHEHYSPFGHCFASFHIKAPVFVSRQLVKHKFLRINEISRRYVDDEPEFYHPDEWRSRSDDKKQGSGEPMDWPHSPYAYPTSLDNYKFLLQMGVAPEQARMVLPQSMMTEWYWSGSLDAFASMCKLRLKSDSQYESRLVAQQVSTKMGQLYPVSWEALINAA
ncbi:THY1 Predicted alternative thymidylate synthase [uncultured Caudovirales phage]|uniref:THY1 Predicted alternative thymidylate synthase n=1 Tax=uncultured Caudovirales phage TaxID=2100421 RepID=A0A6J5LYP0_9CAUD|nr:THY1 Predicted alternative thymidylate synthase [uncultured Caudovirales phage]